MTSGSPWWVKALPGASFLAAMAIHASWRMAGAIKASAWEDLASSQPSALLSYLANGDVLLGISYGAATALACYGISRMALNRRAGLTGAVGGLSLASLLAVTGCFLVGCCGSPMLGVWTALLGAKALGGGKVVIAALTLASVAGGWSWLNRCCLRNRCGKNCR